MGRVRLFHWKAEGASEVADTLRRAGYAVDYHPTFSPVIFRQVRDDPPDAVIIDLSRLPANGREIATAIRGNKRIRQLPILFLDGAADKVAIVQQKLPDAAYCVRSRLVVALRKCIRDRPENPIVPPQMKERFAGRSTAQKLGIKEGSKVAVIDAPRDYARVIGALPQDVEFEEESQTDCSIVIWFVEEPEPYLAALPRMRRVAASCKLWIAWPKKAARKDSLLSEPMIREMAIDSGLVDYKICSINETWSGMCFAVKKTGRG